MQYAYPVLYYPDAGSPEIYNAFIPGLNGSDDLEDGAETCGDTPEDVRRMASGLVDAWLVTYMRNGEPIPQPGALPQGDGWELARPSLRVLCALTLRELRAKAGWSQAETARRLGIKQPVYANLEDPKKANPTVSTLDRLARAFGKHFALAVE